MSYKFDHTTDYSGKELYAFTHNVNLPEFIKQADVAVENAQPLEKEAYADQDFKAFPINTAENTYLSYVHFINKQAAITKEYGKAHVQGIESRIKTAGTIFEISEHLDAYAKEQKANLTKKASIKDIGFVKVASDKLPTYSYATREDLEKVCSVFNDDLSMFSFSDRVNISKELVKAAQEEGLDEIPDPIAKYAGLGFLNTEVLDTELFRRKAKLAAVEDRQKVDAVYDALKQASTPEEQMKAAEELYNIEFDAGLYFNEKTAAVLGDFVDHVFMTADKVASMLDEVIYVGKSPFSKFDLEKVSADVYKQAFDLDVEPTKIAEHKDALATMPESDVELFRNLAGI